MSKSIESSSAHVVGFIVFLKKLLGAQIDVTRCAGNLISFRLQQLASSRVVWVDINGFGWHWTLDFEQTFDVVEDQSLLPQVRDILVLPVADQALPHANLSSSDAPHLVDHVQLDLVRDEQLLLKRNHFKVLELAQPTWDWTQFERPVKVKGIWPLWPCGHSCIEREQSQRKWKCFCKKTWDPFLLLDLSRWLKTVSKLFRLFQNSLGDIKTVQRKKLLTSHLASVSHYWLFDMYHLWNSTKSSAKRLLSKRVII